MKHRASSTGALEEQQRRALAGTQLLPRARGPTCCRMMRRAVTAIDAPTRCESF
jgi:hypothetical protein